MKRIPHLLAALLLLLGVSSAQEGGKKGKKRTDIPPGAPWRTDYRSARWEALRAGKPLFLYFTKTY